MVRIWNRFPPALAGACLYLMLVHAAQAVELASIPTTGLSLRYDVLRDGDKIGEHEFVFTRTGDAVNVTVKTDVRVKLGFITLYRFWHEGSERWVDGRMVELASKTDDDGTKHELKVQAVDGKLQVLHDGKPIAPVAAETIPASLWHKGILDVPATLNTIDGSMMAIKTSLAGDEQVPAPTAPKPAKHYLITGELQRELWFSPDGNLVRVRFKAQDKSDIQYVLSRAP
ncbi:MAG: hypothetical protein IT563_15840 [Alphaproteobacteria bacterium]|nr:hypothetical protein [Alphaproteobacteria bacterium]